MTSFSDDLQAVRVRAISELFAQLPTNVEYIGVQVDGEPIESACFADKVGAELFPYPMSSVFAPMNAVFGLRHEGLAEFAVPFEETPERVRVSLHSASGYLEGFPLTLRRPTVASPARPKYKPAREDGFKSWTVAIQGGLTPTKEVFAPSAAAARRAVAITLPKFARIIGITRTLA